jgi:hypothetical protein
MRVISWLFESRWNPANSSKTNPNAKIPWFSQLPRFPLNATQKTCNLTLSSHNSPESSHQLQMSFVFYLRKRFQNSPPHDSPNNTWKSINHAIRIDLHLHPLHVSQNKTKIPEIVSKHQRAKRAEFPFSRYLHKKKTCKQFEFRTEVKS